MKTEKQYEALQKELIDTTSNLIDKNLKLMKAYTQHKELTQLLCAIFDFIENFYKAPNITNDQVILAREFINQCNMRYKQIFDDVFQILQINEKDKDQ